MAACRLPARAEAARWAGSSTFRPMAVRASASGFTTADRRSWPREASWALMRPLRRNANVSGARTITRSQAELPGYAGDPAASEDERPAHGFHSEHDVTYRGKAVNHSSIHVETRLSPANPDAREGIVRPVGLR